MSSNNITRRDPAASALPNKLSLPVDDFLYNPDSNNYGPSLQLLPMIIMSDDWIKIENAPAGIKNNFVFKPDVNELLKMQFAEIQKTIRSLWVENDNKDPKNNVCRVCTDFSEEMYNQCLWAGGQRDPITV